MEGAESKEVSELFSEEAEVSEQPSEGVSGEGLVWMEHVVALGTVEGARNRKYCEGSLELGGGQSLKNAKGVRGWSWQNSETVSEWKTGYLLTITWTCSQEQT